MGKVVLLAQPDRWHLGRRKAVSAWPLNLKETFNVLNWAPPLGRALRPEPQENGQTFMYIRH